jgi:hypothetical protein
MERNRASYHCFDVLKFGLNTVIKVKPDANLKINSVFDINEDTFDGAEVMLGERYIMAIVYIFLSRLTSFKGLKSL